MKRVPCGGETPRGEREQKGAGGILRPSDASEGRRGRGRIGPRLFFCAF